MGIAVGRVASSLEQRLDAPIEEWLYLGQEVLVPARSRKVCMTCHWFRHHAGANCTRLLICQLSQGLIVQGEHLANRCQDWISDGRQVLKFKPIHDDHWSQRLEVVSCEL